MTEPKKELHKLTLTRGALYLAEGCMQDYGPCTTPAKTVLWAQVWNKLRRLNDRGIKVSWSKEPIDMEKPVLRSDSETELEFKRRDVEMNAAVEAWNNEQITIELRPKHYTAVLDAVKYVNTNQNKPNARRALTPSLHSLSLLMALDLAEDDDESVAADSVDVVNA